MEPESRQTDPGFESLRVHRAELLEAIRTLEQALAAPVAGRPDAWAERVKVALVELSADFREHVGLTEGPDGLYRGVLSTAPRLSSTVSRLTEEHALIQGMAEHLLHRVDDRASPADVEDVREDGTALLARLSRHRQRGADLVYEAYQADIGGET